jgi:outer membrane receptor protein involved in Fe transport
MFMKHLTFVLTAWLVFGFAAVSFGQGVQTGTIRGQVKDQQGLAVPGVTVSVTSPALQGSRTALTDVQGLYAIPALPAGTYRVSYELSGFTTIEQTTNLLLGLTVEQNVTMRPAGVSETIQVVAETPAPIATPIVGQNFKHDEIELLATPRTIEGIAQLAPAVNEHSPNVGQLVVNGAFAFDNVFMVNGVDINDNLFAQPQNLFIEDAIEETQVLTSGISAEYGRFTGGVVNAITKSGGNIFSGSGRINFSNPNWTTATPFEVAKGTAAAAHPSTLSESWEGTFGGPIVKDRLWFFTSGRYASLNGTTGALPQTGLVLPTNDLNKRGEVKITATAAQNHTIQGGFLTDPRTRTNNSGLQSFVIDPHSEPNRSNPNWYYYTNYRGVLRNNLLVEAQYSQRHFQFLNDGGTSASFGPSVTQADLIANSPFLSATQCACVYNAPYFDTSDPENRNNRQISGSVTSFWNLKGRHETKAGYEWFRSQRTGGNSQSATEYVFNADFLTNAAGSPVLDSTGRPIPVFEPGTTYLDYYPAVKGAVLNVDNNSAYVQDHWTISSKWSADLGARYEHVKALSTGNIVSVDNNRIVPRLAVGYDVKGNGDHVIHVTYGMYSGRYNEAQIGANSPVGNPADIEPTYLGPPGQGYNFAPGFNLANYPVTSANASVSDPLQNIKMDPNLKSPVVNEFTTSYGANLVRGRGYASGTYVFRRTTDLIEDYQTLSTGFTDVVVNGISAGTFTNYLYANASSDQAHRQYQALVFQSRYRLTDNWTLNGHYTVELQNEGNYEGEGTNQPGHTSFIGNYPEAFSADRNFPVGNLQNMQRNRVRVWSAYNFRLGPAGDLSVSGLWRFDSGLVYSIAARNQPLTSTQTKIIAAAGYPDVPPSSGNMVFFGGRGTETFPSYALFDMSMNYNVPVFRSLRPWVKFDVYNLFNNQKLIAWNTTVSQNKAAGVDSLGLATNYTQGSAFGTASGNTVTNLFQTAINAYPVAFSGAPAGGRTFRVAVGFRF